ncbi:MAG: hypothetical protein V3V00_05280 [Saprospiraceae bacterium]
MNDTLRNILAVVAGVLIGGVVNMGIVKFGASIIPNPEGYDFSTLETMKENFHLLHPKNFIVPLLAHALGTLAGAFVITKIAVSHHLKLALFLGAFFLIGGITMVVRLPSTPIWFAALDLLGAYLPMAWLGHKLGRG